MRPVSAIYSLCVCFVVILVCARPAFATYPVVDEVKGLPYPELITVYPDDRDPHLYYFVPTTVAIQKHDNGSLAFGVQYWGLTGLDPAGSGAALNVTVIPAWDKDKVKAVSDAILKSDPQAKFSVPNLIGSSMELIVNSHFVPKNQNTTSPISTIGNTVDATQAFTLELNNIGARAFSQGVAKDSDVMAARYTYKFRGVGKRLHARVTVYYKRVYDHFKATASASAWYGLVTSSWSVDWQKLTKDGSIKLEILSGGVTGDEDYMLEVFKNLVNTQIAGEGMFKPELKPGGVNTQTGGALMGWGFSASGGWEHLEEDTNQVYEIDRQTLEDREFSTGMSFSSVCAGHPENFVDLTVIGNHCIDQVDFAALAKANDDCVQTKLQRLRTLYDNGLITKAAWEAKSTEALDSPCYSSIGDPLMQPLNINKMLLDESIKESAARIAKQREKPKE
jgi:hypothetical protein